MKRKTLDQLDLDLVFSLTHNGLIFGRISGEDIFSDSRIVSLLGDPEVQEYCGLPLVAEKIENNNAGPDRWGRIPTPPIDLRINHQLHVYSPTTEKLTAFLSTRDELWCRDPENTKLLKAEEEYYGCTLPHKHILGCRACLHDTQLLPGSCRIKFLRLTGTFNIPPVLHEYLDIRQPVNRSVTFKSGEKTIGEFTYISARYTALEDKVFIEKTRTVKEHAFYRIPERIKELAETYKESAEKAHKTRKKYKDVQ